MSRGIHKLRVRAQIKILLENLGNVSNSAGGSHSFGSKPVGSGAGRTIILLCTAQDGDVSSSRISGCTVDGTSAVIQTSIERAINNQVVDTAIFTLELTTESGNVTIGITSTFTPTSWGLSYIVVKSQKSITAVDTASKSTTSSSAVTSSTLEGDAGGVAVGVAAHSSKDSVHTWGSLMTEKADLSSGSGAGHRHSAAFDLLPGGRAASVETVLSSASDRFALSTATFR